MVFTQGRGFVIGALFEFHGWASIQYRTRDTDSVHQDECWSELIAHVEAMPNDLVQLRRYSGIDSLHVAGQHNHRSDYVIDLFRWVAADAPGSYGLLYIRDDEDHNRGGDDANCFRVWRLARGELAERDDPLLSPVIPTVEDPFDESRGD